MKFPYSVLTSTQSASESMPRIPIVLSVGDTSFDTVALVGSGSMVNVLPFQAGMALGLVWEEAKATLRLGGILSAHPAMPVKVQAIVSDMAPSALSFAWTRASLTMIILGQVNFFMEYEVTFRRWLLEFEVNKRPE